MVAAFITDINFNVAYSHSCHHPRISGTVNGFVPYNYEKLLTSYKTMLAVSGNLATLALLCNVIEHDKVHCHYLVCAQGAA